MIIGFIGTGNMGGSILKGYAGSRAAEGKRILISNRNEEHSRRVCEQLGDRAEIAENNLSLCNEADIVIIGVKPQGVDSVLDEIAPAFWASKDGQEAGNKLLVSMAAGISMAHIEEQIGSKMKIVRIMPNTPARVGEAMTSLSANRYVEEKDLARVKSIFDSVGLSEIVDESMIDCVIGVSGSSPAYTYMYIEALAKAAEKNGMEYSKARDFAAQAVLGAAKMVLESDETIEQLRINVCSPGGTTIEAVNRLFENGFMDKVMEGFQAAVDRSMEMTGSRGGVE